MARGVENSQSNILLGRSTPGEAAGARGAMTARVRGGAMTARVRGGGSGVGGPRCRAGGGNEMKPSERADGTKRRGGRTNEKKKSPLVSF